MYDSPQRVWLNGLAKAMNDEEIIIEKARIPKETETSKEK
jgi:hypothetical protein